LRIAFSSAARRDRQNAEVWYGRRSRRARASFTRELQAALRFISEYPEGAPQIFGDCRGKTLQHFPYSIIYEVHSDRILVLAVADERREPGTYDDRL
jgi:plasmid stabilization system protein ParE